MDPAAHALQLSAAVLHFVHFVLHEGQMPTPPLEYVPVSQSSHSLFPPAEYSSVPQRVQLPSAYP
jgi:hypothetical protein